MINKLIKKIFGKKNNEKLTKEEFDEFVNEVAVTYRLYSFWYRFQNTLAKDRPLFNLHPTLWTYIYTALRNDFMLHFARLLDKAYFIEDHNKKNPRLSIYFIAEKNRDNNLTKELKKRLRKYNRTIYSIKPVRDNLLAHKTVGVKKMTVKGGIEDILKIFEWFIEKIKHTAFPNEETYSLNLEEIFYVSEIQVNEFLKEHATGPSVKDAFN